MKFYPFFCHSLPTAESSLLAKGFAISLGPTLPRKKVIRLTDRPDMTIVLDWDVKPQINQLTVNVCVILQLPCRWREGTDSIYPLFHRTIAHDFSDEFSPIPSHMVENKFGDQENKR